MKPVALLACVCSLIEMASAREWTSLDGRKLEADFVSATATAVTLRRAIDRKVFTIELSKLSEADRIWVARAKQPAPAGMEDDDGFTCNFEQPGWEKDWDLGNPNLPRNWVVSDKSDIPGMKFPTGKALEITFKQGTHYGADFGYNLKEPGAESEPEAASLDYRICFAPDFNAEAVQGGKLPGFGGVYGNTGSAGKRVNGRDSWSARGAYWKPDNRGRIPIGFYVYHADMENDFGDSWYFSKPLERGEWHTIRLFIKLNTPSATPDGKGRNDGILRGWVNGRKVYENEDIRFRDTEKLKIRNAWFHFYHGGGSPATEDYKLWIDDVKISVGE